MFRAVPLPIIRRSLTVHLALVYVIRFEDTIMFSLHTVPAHDRINICTFFKCPVPQII